MKSYFDWLESASTHPKKTLPLKFGTIDLCLLCLSHFLLASEGVGFGCLSFNSSFSGSLDLGTFGVHLLLECLLTLLLRLCPVNLTSISLFADTRSKWATYVLNKRTLVLECVTLGLLVQRMV